MRLRVRSVLYFVNKNKKAVSNSLLIHCVFSHTINHRNGATIMSETTAIDCLPYYDTFDESDRAQAMKLVEQEMKTFAAKDYLEDQPISSVEFAVCSRLG
jgi:hypothetical protein